MMRFSAVSEQWTVTTRRFGRDSYIDCARGRGNNLQNSDHGSGESYGRIRAWGLWYPGSPNARYPGAPGNISFFRFPTHIALVNRLVNKSPQELRSPFSNLYCYPA